MGRNSDSDNRMILNIGPSHPVTHGTVRLVVKLDGEFIEEVDVQVGYLHRGFEKMCENSTFHQVIPYTDRLNYCSALINNFAYVQAVEKLCQLEITEKCKYIRTLLSEFSRIADHLTCIGASYMELGAMSAFLYMMKEREYIWEHMAHVTGSRVTPSYARIGGVACDLPPGWLDSSETILKGLEKTLEEVKILMDSNPIFFDRMRNTGKISKEEALNLGFTGPCLRSTGVPLDVRKYDPYLAYGELDFQIPVGKYGDNFDRYFVRMREIEESVKLVRQCIRKMPKSGNINVDRPDIILPPKDEVYNTIEGVIKHFKIIIDGPRIPKGEEYSATEGANGEIGFYIVSDGSGKPYKLRLRPPSFILMGGLHRMLKGYQIADIVPTFGSINMIGGECDR